MYFTNIAHKELELFHGLKSPNFTISLTSILTSPLFKIETIKPDTIYRVYPLFYCKTITSSNEDDKILDDKVIICHKLDDAESWYTFMSHENEPIYDYTEYGTYYDIGDELTVEEFNGIISMLRKFIKHTDNIRLTQGTIKGTYGDYILDIDNTTMTDKGIIITNGTISQGGSVRLENNAFESSKYRLHLKVYHFTDINITGEESEDNIVWEDLIIDLKPYEDVQIPFNELGEDYVIIFDAQVNIDHTTPIIKSDYFFKDECKTDHTQVYENIITNGDDTLTPTITYNDNQYYVFDASTRSDHFAGFEIPNTQGQDNILLRLKVKLNSNNAYCQAGLGFATQKNSTDGGEFLFIRLRGDSKLDYIDNNTNSTLTSSITTYDVTRTLELIRHQNTININLYDENDEAIYTGSHTLGSDFNPEDCHYFFCRNMKDNYRSSNLYEITAKREEE